MVATTILAGCGDDEAGDSEAYAVEASTTVTVASPPLTKPQFVSRLNRICRKAWDTVHDNWDVYTGTQSLQLSARERFEEAVRLSLLAGLDFHIFDNVRALGAPPGQADEIEAIIGPFQAAVELGWKERWRAYSIEEIAPQFETYNRLARRYGLDDCLVTHARLGPLEA